MKLMHFGFSCCFLITIGLVQSGCVSQLPPVSEEYKASPAVQKEKLAEMKKMTGLPDINHINERLSFYQGRFTQWKGLENRMVSQGITEQRPLRWRQCGTLLEQMVNGYSQLHEQYMQEKGLGAVKKKVESDPWVIHRQDIQYLESGCDNVVDSGQEIVSGAPADVSETPETLLFRYASEGEYDKAIEVYRDMIVRYSDRAAVPKVKRVYGMALLRTRNIDAAIKVLPQTLEQLRKDNPDSWAQHRLVADLYFATGEVEMARKEYEKLAAFFATGTMADNGWNGVDLWVADQLALFRTAETPGGDQGLTIFISVMRSFITFDGKNLPEPMVKAVQRLGRIFPDSKYTNRGRQILWQAEDQVRIWVTGKLYSVDSLITGEEFDKALTILEELLSADLSDELRGQVKKRKDDVVIAKVRAEKTQEYRETESLENLWQEALNLFELQRYDEAIEAFSYFSGTEYEEEALQKTGQASDIAAKRMRRQAATLFVQARRSDSRDQKLELFVESWKMLNQILAQYPKASILEKVLQNMIVIEDAIRKEEPAVLETLGERTIVEGLEEDNSMQEGIVEEDIKE